MGDETPNVNGIELMKKIKTKSKVAKGEWVDARI